MFVGSFNNNNALLFRVVFHIIYFQPSIIISLNKPELSNKKRREIKIKRSILDVVFSLKFHYTANKWNRKHNKTINVFQDYSFFKWRSLCSRNVIHHHSQFAILVEKTVFFSVLDVLISKLSIFINIS